jgi:thiamine pyrophosphate-dependent acetolactate synthase large subunit-like protein
MAHGLAADEFGFPGEGGDGMTIGIDPDRAVQLLVEGVPGCVVVSTMETTRTMHRLYPRQPNFSCVPLMGASGPLGVGLALGCPNRPVVVMDGDGSLLMQLNTLVTAADHAGANLLHAVFDNGIWYTNGGYLKRVGTRRAHLAPLAAAAGFANAVECTSEDALRTAVSDFTQGLMANTGPTFMAIRIEADISTPFCADNPQRAAADQHFRWMLDESRTLRDLYTGSASAR